MFLRRLKHLGVGGALIAGSLAWMLTSAQIAQAAPVTLKTASGFNLFGVANLHFENAICDNTGSTINVSGSIDLGDAGFRVRMSNNAYGTKEATADRVANVQITQNTAPTPIPKQPAQGGVGGNPWISFDLVGDGQGPIVLGRCVQGVTVDLVDILISVPAFGEAVMQSMECSNLGSRLGLGLGSGQSGVAGTLYFDNNINRVVQQKQAASHFDVSLYAPITPRKGAANAEGAGGNPHIYGRFFRPDSDFVDAWNNADVSDLTPDGLDDVTGQSAWDSAKPTAYETFSNKGNAAFDNGTPGTEVYAGRCRSLM